MILKENDFTKMRMENGQTPKQTSKQTVLVSTFAILLLIVFMFKKAPYCCPYILYSYYYYYRT